MAIAWKNGVVGEAQDELAWLPSVPARRIHVAERKGTVALTGVVRSYVHKWEAERALERVRGVRSIVNEIVVEPAQSLPVDELLGQAWRRLRSDPRVPDQGIHLTVSDGWLVLEGQVDWDYQRRAAADVVRSLPALRGVTNAITIRPQHHRRKPGEPQLDERLAAALARDANLDSSEVNVCVSGGQVTLRGFVASLAAKREVEERAWSAPGVWAIDNELVVDPGLATNERAIDADAVA